MIKMETEQFEGRKRDHIRHALDLAHQATGLSGLNSFHLTHEALPDFDFSEIQLETSCLGIRLPTPFYIAGMTAGHENANAINRSCSLALAPNAAGHLESVRNDANSWTLPVPIAGQSFAKNFQTSWCLPTSVSLRLRIFRSKKYARLSNPFKREPFAFTSMRFKKLYNRRGPQTFAEPSPLLHLIRELELPVVSKETGWAFSLNTGANRRKLISSGLAAVDVSGLGGTHWGRIEGLARRNQSLCKAAETFANWGEPTAEVVTNAGRCLEYGHRNLGLRRRSLRTGRRKINRSWRKSHRLRSTCLAGRLQGPEHFDRLDGTTRI